MAEYVIIGGLLAGGYLLAKKNAQGVTPASVTPVTGGGTSPLVSKDAAIGPVPLHLLVGAKLLTDSQIADMEIALVKYWTYPKTDPPRFKQTVLTDHLPNEFIKPAPQCSQAGNFQGPPLAITVTKEGQLALSTTSAITSGLKVANAFTQAIPIIGSIIGVGLSIFSAISAHHQAAVRNEQGLECSLIPPANQSLAVIEQAVMNGTLTIQQGQTALDTLYIDFRRAATNGQSGQLEERPGRLNAMGWYAHFLHAIILKKQNRYANLAG